MSTNLTNKQIGQIYEELCLSDLRLEHPNSEVHYWGHSPERLLTKFGLVNDYDLQRRRRVYPEPDDPELKHGLPDIGVDIVVFYEKNCIIVQCKGGEQSVNQHHLGTFHHMLVEAERCLERIPECELTITGQVWWSGKLSPYVQRYPGYVCRYRQMEYLTSQVQPQIDIVVPQKLWTHQEEAIEQIKQKFSGRGIFSMACGTGKTRCVAEVCKETYSKVILFSPLQAHADDNFTRFKPVLKRPCKTVHSGERGSREVDTLTTFVTQHDSWFISTVFDSVDVIDQLVKQCGLEDVLVVIDEFHNLPRNRIFQKDDPWFNLLNSTIKILFVSATPRLFELEDESSGQDQIKKYFGDELFVLPMAESIRRKLTCDYRVIIPLFEDTKSELEGVIIPENVDDSWISRAEFLLTGMFVEGARKCIIYTHSHKDAEQMVQAIGVLSAYQGVTINCATILSEDNGTTRQSRLDTFQKTDGWSILVSCRILNECVDVPACDSIFLAQPTQVGGESSKIRFVQQMSRATRLNEQQPHKIAKVFVWATASSDVLDFASCLKSVDPEFVTKISCLSRTYVQPVVSGERDVVRKKQVEGQLELVRRAVTGVAVYDRNAYHMKRAVMWVEWRKLHDGKKPVAVRRIKDAEQDKQEEYRLGNWCRSYKENQSNCQTQSVNDYLDVNYPDWSSKQIYTHNAVEHHKKRVHEFLKWMQDNAGKLPNRKSKTSEEERSLGHWFNNYKNSGYKHEEINDLLDKEYPEWRAKQPRSRPKST
jgi:superfamily II DNA or RNA helicase